MKQPRKSRGPRPRIIPRVPGLSYGNLDEHLGYVLRRAQLGGFEAFQRATAHVDITPPRYTALTIVGANPGLSQSALGAALGTARSGAMLLADWLEARGLAERRRREGDGRAWGLHLTQRFSALRKVQAPGAASPSGGAGRATAAPGACTLRSAEKRCSRGSGAACSRRTRRSLAGLRRASLRI
jgi:DNA-binding MarR family transcriptional regulator